MTYATRRFAAEKRKSFGRIYSDSCEEIFGAKRQESTKRLAVGKNINNEVSHLKNSKVGISVIIPTYQRGAELCQVLSQLLAQDDPVEEIIVVDQTPCHDPQTQDFLQNLVKLGKIRLIFNTPPGLPEARNRGIREARQEVLLFLDDDVDIKPDLVRMYRMSYDEPGVDAVSGAMLMASLTELTDIIPPFVLKERWGWLDFPLNYSKKTRRIMLVGCNFSLKREVALKVRGFDENYIWPSWREDNDFSWRVHRFGAGIVYNPACVVYNRRPTYGGCYYPREVLSLPFIREIVNQNYFFLKNAGLSDNLLKGLRYFRMRVLNRNNLLKPYLFIIACWRYFAGSVWALYLALRGRKLMNLER